MRNTFLFIFLLAAPLLSFAQRDQDPDTLVWNGRRYAVTVDAHIPSVVQSWFQITGTKSPFNFWSNTNSRGHIATFEVIGNMLCVTSIEAKRFRTRIGNLWTESGIDTSAVPEYFGISSIASGDSFASQFTTADWFSGILELSLVPSDKKDLKSAEYDGRRYLYFVNGSLIGNIFVSNADRRALLSGKPDPRLQPLDDFLALRKRYTSFYLRCAADREHVSFNGHEGLFENSLGRLTLVMQLFGNNPLLCPSNWQNDGSGAPFGTWVIRNDSLFLTAITAHQGDSLYSYKVSPQFMPDWLADSVTPAGVVFSSRTAAPDGSFFADWISGDYVIHYGDWQTNSFGVPDYVVHKTHRIRFANGIVTSSQFSPRSFDDDEAEIAASGFSPCNPSDIWSVDDKQLASVLGNFKHPKKAPAFKGDKAALRTWFLGRPLTDDRARDRLFRVRIAFLVNCNGEPGLFQIINSPKGELYEFSNMVLEIVKGMPKNWLPAEDKKGSRVDCWQVLEFTVSNGSLTNANYK